MCLEEFLTGERGGHWDSAGEFGLGDSIAPVKPLPRLRIGNDGRWIDEFITHAVQVGATCFELTDCGGDLDETIGLRLDYDAPRPQTSLIETSLRSFTRGEPYNDRLALALARLRDSGTRIGEWRFGLAEAHFAVCCTDQCLRFDLLTGESSVSDAVPSRWTYSLSVQRHRPLFSYSFFGHPEIAHAQALDMPKTLSLSVVYDRSLGLTVRCSRRE